MPHTANAAAPAKSFRDRFLAAARQFPWAPALVQKNRGVWTTLSWRDVAEELDRIGAGLTELGLVPGGKVAVQGEITASLFLAAAAARSEGAILHPVAAAPKSSKRGPKQDEISLAIVQGREAVVDWLASAGGTSSFYVVFDHATPAGRSPTAGVVTLATLRSHEPSGWSADVRGKSALGTGPALAWAQESTHWTEGLDVLLDFWVDSAAPLALPELLSAAARDRTEIAPSRWIASAAAIEAEAVLVRERLPAEASLTGRLVRHALSAAAVTWARPVLAVLRSRLGLSRVGAIEIYAGRASPSTENLFRSLRSPLRAPAKSGAQHNANLRDVTPLAVGAAA